MPKREAVMTLVDGVVVKASAPDTDAWRSALQGALERKLLARVTSDPEHFIELRCDWERGEAHWRLAPSALPPEPADDGHPTGRPPCTECNGTGTHRRICRACYHPGSVDPPHPSVVVREGEDDSPCLAAEVGSAGLHGPFFSPGPCGKCGGSGTGFTPQARWLHDHFSRATLSVALGG